MGASSFSMFPLLVSMRSLMQIANTWDEKVRGINYQHATCRHNHSASLMRQRMLMFELARSLGTEIFAPKVIAEGVDWAQQEVISDCWDFRHSWLKTWSSLNSITHFCQSPSYLRLLLFVGRCVQHETQWFDALDLQCATFFQHIVTNHSQVHFSSVFQVTQELFQRHHLNCQRWRFTSDLSQDPS